MNVRQGIRVAAVLRSFAPPISAARVEIPMAKQTVSDVSQVNSLLSQLTLQPLAVSPFLTPVTLNVPVPKFRIEIKDPINSRTGDSKDTPTGGWGRKEISLPKLKDVELIEPLQETVIEKKAARLIVIRRAKMKKHKWKKLQKRMKFEFAKVRQKRELKKEKLFQATLLAQVKEAEKFNAEEYVANKIKTAKWEKPITRVRGFYAPDWVIREHLKSQEEETRMKRRLDDCIRANK